MKKKLMIILFFVILLLPDILFFIPTKEKEHMNTENRVLAELPNFALNNIANIPHEVKAYMTDHVAFRHNIRSTYATMNWLVDSVDSDEVLKGQQGWLFFTSDYALHDYMGTSLFTEEELSLYAQMLSIVNGYYESQGRTFLFYIAPNKSSIYEQYMPSSYIKASEFNRAKQLYSYLIEHTEVTIVFPKQLLKDISQDYLIYYKLDTHWNPVGAFAGTQPIITACGGTAVSLDDLDISYTEKRRGDLSDLLTLSDRYCHDFEAEYANPYASGTQDDRSVLLLGDSFSNFINPVLINYYNGVNRFFIADMENEIITEHHEDIVILQLVERNLNMLPIYVTQLVP